MIPSNGKEVLEPMLTGCKSTEVPNQFRPTYSHGRDTQFSLWQGVWPEGPKIGACRTDQRQIWRFAELIFDNNADFCPWIFCPMRPPELDFWVNFL